MTIKYAYNYTEYPHILKTPFNSNLYFNCTYSYTNYKGTTNIRKPNIQYI